MKNICTYNNFLNENNLSVIDISDYKIGDKCLVVDTIDIFTGHIRELNRYIGWIGTVVEIDGDNVQLLFDDNDKWFFDYSSVRTLNETPCIDIKDIQINKLVRVGKKISSYIRGGLADINDMSDDDDLEDTIFNELYNKTGRIIGKENRRTTVFAYYDDDGNYTHDITSNRWYKSDMYVKVKFDKYGEFWLPYLVLYDVVPTYKSKRIERTLESINGRYENFIFNVNNSEELIKLENIVFSMGYEWFSGAETHSQMYMEYPIYIFLITHNKKIFYSPHLNLINSNPVQTFYSRSGTSDINKICPTVFNYNDFNKIPDIIKNGGAVPSYKGKNIDRTI